MHAHTHSHTCMHARTHTHTYTHTLLLFYSVSAESILPCWHRVYHPHGSFLLLVVGWYLLTVWPLHASGHWWATQVAKHTSGPRNQHNKSSHQDQIFDDPLLSAWHCGPKIGSGTGWGVGGGGGEQMHPIGSLWRKQDFLVSPPHPLPSHPINLWRPQLIIHSSQIFQSPENSRSVVSNAQRPAKILKTLKNEWRLRLIIIIMNI